MGLGRYILREGKPVEVDNLAEWAAWYEKADRTLLRTRLPHNVMVSTVFLGLDHGFNDVGPLLWETMVFGGPYDGYMDRHTTEEEARQGHAYALKVANGEVELE